MRPTLIAATTSVALLLAPPVCRGGVEVINHHSGSVGSYTVPDGMVLLLESGINNGVVAKAKLGERSKFVRAVAREIPVGSAR